MLHNTVWSQCDLNILTISVHPNIQSAMYLGWCGIGKHIRLASDFLPSLEPTTKEYLVQKDWNIGPHLCGSVNHICAAVLTQKSVENLATLQRQQISTVRRAKMSQILCDSAEKLFRWENLAHFCTFPHGKPAAPNV
eukprot:TRINITY_DN1857_c0_g1_i4.p3 TRINITY_DN1857_c0_g1~~TRINITY_DN1857_c0_g1_i4.p3  ORF type:complete len:137 (+),score=13.58 TRINITY_DN1857_c0_g1_i4:1603-2013(+)